MLAWLRKAFYFVLRLLLLLLLAVLAWALATGGFGQLRELRQLERTPRSLISALLPGEVNLQGRVRAGDTLLEGPETGQPAVYYRHLIERETRDSEGRRSWRTVSNTARYVDFWLDDRSGEILVQPSSRVDFAPQQRFQRREGDLRYTEYRIDPGDTVFVFGVVRAHADGFRVGFPDSGQYTPIISMDGEGAARGGMAAAALIMLWFALAIGGFAVYLLAWKLRIHVTAWYLLLLSLVLAGGQMHLALEAARADLVAAYERLDRDLRGAENLLAMRLQRHAIGWDRNWGTLGDFSENRYLALPPGEREALSHLRERMAAQVERTHAIAAQFPERWVKPGLKLPQPVQVPLPPGQEPESLRAARSGTRLSPVISAVIGGIALILSIFASVLGFRRIRVKRLIEDLPTSASAGVAYGLAELNAMAMLMPEQKPLHGPLSEREAVWFRYKEEERRGSGRNARWVTLVDRCSDRRFLLSDREGSLPVDPEGAEVITRDTLVRRKGRMRYSEWLFAPGTEVYALGSAEIDPQTQASLALRRGPKDAPFILTDLSEPELKIHKARRAFAWLNGSLNAGNAVGLAAVAALGALHGGGFVLSALVPLAYTALFLAILIYNGLITANQRVRRAWANIQVSLTKRAELLPNLEQIVSAYLQHERGLQTQLAELRTLYTRPDLDPGNALRTLDLEQSLFARLNLLREDYPDLKAHTLATQLMRQIVALENEVALMRIGYNDSVERYNTRREQFPELLFTWLFHFPRAELFRTDIEVHALPEIDFTASPEAPQS